MPLKTSSYLAGHYPKTYMEQFCKALHPELELGTICVAWFRQATKHCTELLSDARAPTAYFWTTFKNFIFPDRSTEMVSQKIPISIHPKRLSIRDCQALFLDIVSDYVQRAPRYFAESITNVMLWRVFHSFLGIMALGLLLICIIYAYNKYCQPKKVINFLEEIFKPEKRLQAFAKRSLRLTKAELRNIHIKPLARTEDIAAADGVQVLVLKVGTKYEFLTSLVKVGLQSVGKFHKRYDGNKETKTDNQVEILNKAIQFLGNCKKLHLLLVFEDGVDYEDEVATQKSESNSPRIKMTSPRHSSRCSKEVSSTPLDRGSARHKATEADISSSPPRFNSPTQASTPRSSLTPRSSTVASSSIPRNVQKRPPISKKSK